MGVGNISVFKLKFLFKSSSNENLYVKNIYQDHDPQYKISHEIKLFNIDETDSGINKGRIILKRIILPVHCIITFVYDEESLIESFFESISCHILRQLKLTAFRGNIGKIQK